MKLNAEQTAQLNIRYAQMDVAKGAAGAVDRFRKSHEDLARIQGLTEKEIKAVGDRAVQMAAQMRESSNSVSILGQSFTSLATQVTALAGAYVTLRSASSFVSESTTLAARYDTLGIVMRTVGENAGYAASELISYQSSLERTGISMLGARQSISQMIQANMDLSASSKLARAAQDAAVIGNINSSEAFGRMTTAIQTAQPEMLRTMGIIVNFDEAYRKYSRAINTSTDALTENQRMAARTAATMEATRAIAGAYQSAMDTPGKQALSLDRYWEDFKVNLGESFQPAYKALIKGTTDALKDFTEVVKDPSFQDSMKDWAEALGGVAKAMAEVAKYSAMRPIADTFVQGMDLAKQGRIDTDAFIHASFLERQRMVDALIRPDKKEAGTQEIINGGRPNSHSQPSLDSPYTSEIPRDGEFEKLYKAQQTREAYDLKDFISKFLDKNRSYQSTSALLDEATKTWTGERSNASRAQALAQAMGDSQMYADAQKMQAEADQKLIETRQQLIKANDDVRRSVQSLSSAALSAQADLFGDSRTSSAIKDLQTYNDELAQFRARMAAYKGDDKESVTQAGEYWINYNKGIREAKRELEDFRNTLSTVGDLMSDLGRLSGSPEASYQGAMFNLKEEKDAASKRPGANQDLVNQVYVLKSQQAWQESYKGLTTIDGSAFDARRAMLSREVEDFRKAGADEVALRVYAAQKAEDIARDELQTRQAYAGSFTDFLRGQLTIEAGLYRGAQSRQLAEWSDYYNDLKGLTTGYYDTLKNGSVDILDGLFDGKKAEDALKNTLANLRRQILQFGVNIIFDWGKNKLFQPVLDQIAGTSPSDTSRKTVEGAARGLASQAVTAPSSESVLAWLGQGVPTYTPSLVEEITAPAKQAAEAVAKVTSGPLWQRNNNPGNLRSLAGPFQHFDTMEDGTRAMSDWLVRNGKRGYDTPEKIIYRYAPPSENNSEKYVQTVVSASGYARDQKLDLNDPDVRQRIMKPMIQAETGRKDAVPDDMLYRATHLAKFSSQPYGPAGEEGTRAVASAASSYGLLGVNFGQLGAQSILSKIDTRGGLWSAFTGDSASYAWNTSNVTQAGGGMGSSFWNAPTGGNVWDVSSYTNPLAGLSSTDATTAAKLVAMGMSPDDAVTMVTGGGAGGVTMSQAVNSQTAQQGTNFNASDLLKSSGSGSWVDSLNEWGLDKLGIGSRATQGSWGLDANGQWVYSESASGPITGGLGTIAGGALTGAATGFGISSLVYPNGTGTIGGTIGGLAGGALGSTLLGSALGGPIGGLLGGVIGSVLGGSETKKTEKTGSGVTVNITNGDITQRGYSTYRTTTSGMFGSTSTSHSKSYDTVGDPELERAFASVLENYTAQNWRSSVNMGISTSALRSFSFPFDFDINDENASFAAKSVANYQAYQLLDNAGLRGEFDEVAKSGEVYVDEIKRISDAYNTGSIAASAAGTSLEKLSGTMSTVFQGDWFSQVADLLGGTSQASGAFSTYVKYGLSKTQAVDYALSAYAGGAGSAIAQLGDSSVSMGNFWGKYQEAMNSGNMSAETFALWANAASYMSSYSDTQYQALDLMQTINNVRIAQLKEEITEVQNVKVMVDGLNTSVSSAYSTYKSLYDTLTSTIQSITWNASLSPNTPSMTFAQQQAYYNELKTKVASEDSSSITWSSDIQKLTSFSQTYLQSARSYYGASSKYYEIYGDVTSTLTSLQTSTKTELDVLQEQLAAQYTVVNQNQAQIDQLTLANTNLQILGAGLDGLGTDISSGLSAIVSALGSSWGSNWDNSVASAMQAYADAYASTTASLATTATVDTSSLSSTDWSSLSTLTGYASGGDPAAGEWAYVGEQGPELVRFGKDARVYNANETKAILAAKDGDNKAVVAAVQSLISANASGQSALLKAFQGMTQEFQRMRIVAERQAAK